MTGLVAVGASNVNQFPVSNPPFILSTPSTRLPVCLCGCLSRFLSVKIRCNHNHSFDTANKKPTQLPGICFTQFSLVLAPSSLENQGPYYMGDLA